MLADVHHRCGSPGDVQRTCLGQAGNSALTKLMRFRLKLWEHGPMGSTGSLAGGRGRGLPEPPDEILTKNVQHALLPLKGVRRI